MRSATASLNHKRKAPREIYGLPLPLLPGFQLYMNVGYAVNPNPEGSKGSEPETAASSPEKS